MSEKHRFIEDPVSAARFAAETRERRPLQRSGMSELGFRQSWRGLARRQLVRELDGEQFKLAHDAWVQAGRIEPIRLWILGWLQKTQK